MELPLYAPAFLPSSSLPTSARAALDSIHPKPLAQREAEGEVAAAAASRLPEAHRVVLHGIIWEIESQSPV